MLTSLYELWEESFSVKQQGGQRCDTDFNISERKSQRLKDVFERKLVIERQIHGYNDSGANHFTLVGSAHQLERCCYSSQESD